MKKSIIFAVALAASAAAFAQSNVTLYGVADVGAAYTKSDGQGPNVKSGVMSSLWEQSFVGVKGSEALGNGLRATFALEQTFDTASSNAQAAREQNIGLAGSFGAIKLGRMETAGSLYAKQFDVMGKTQFSPLTVAQGGAEFLLNSTVGYQGTAGGFNFGGSYTSDGSSNAVSTSQAYTNGQRQESVYSANVGYGIGNFAAGFVYTKGDNLARTRQDADTYFVGASYDFKVVKLAGSYLMVDAKSNSGQTDMDVYSVGVTVPFSALTRVDAAYSRAEVDFNNANANIYGVQVSHNMSKRTLAYAGYQYVDNSNGTTFAALGSAAGTPTLGTSQGFGAGIRHAF